MKKVVFVDRDGTLIWEPGENPDDPAWIPDQVDSLDKLRFLDGVKDALKELSENGYVFVMVTNQNGIGSPTFPKELFWEPHNEMMRQFNDIGVDFDEVFICPHFAEDRCFCRKPLTGMVDEYLSSNQIDKESSYMIGDRDTDLEFASNMGVKGIKISDDYPWTKIVRQILG